MGSSYYYTNPETGYVTNKHEYTTWGNNTKAPTYNYDPEYRASEPYFTGHPYDGSLNLYYAEARFYDPETGSFLSSDPAKSGLNWYQYCGSNPTTYVDVLGLWDEKAIKKEIEKVRFYYPRLQNSINQGKEIPDNIPHGPMYLNNLFLITQITDINLSEYNQMVLDKFVVNYQENEAIYQNISDKTGFPPELIALLHYREAGIYLGTEEYFNRYLHNGEQLGYPTQKKPSGKLFYDFDAAAIDALSGDYFVSLKQPLNISSSTKDIAALATFAELYNGTGYFDNGYANPYLYSGTNIYDKGKYVEVFKGNKYEIQYDPDLVDEQIGVSILLAIILG